MNKTRTPYNRYLDAKMLPTPEGHYSPPAMREMQAAMLDALRTDKPLPPEMRRDLSFAFEYLCEGIAYDLLTPVKRSGGREAPIAKHTQEAAIRYLRWCAYRQIPNTEAVRTVAAAYDVEERTVRGWINKWQDKSVSPFFEDWGDTAILNSIKATGKAYRRFIPKPTPKK